MQRQIDRPRDYEVADPLLDEFHRPQHADETCRAGGDRRDAWPGQTPTLRDHAIGHMWPQSGPVRDLLSTSTDFVARQGHSSQADDVPLAGAENAAPPRRFKLAHCEPRLIRRVGDRRCDHLRQRIRVSERTHRRGANPTWLGRHYRRQAMPIARNKPSAGALAC